MTKKEVISILEKADLNDEMDDWEVNDAIHEHTRESFTVSSGMSKICIVFKNLPFVIKYSHNRYEDKEDGVDESVQEAELYQAAKVAGIEMFFPKTEILCTINYVTFVAQEKIDYSTSGVPFKKKDKYCRVCKTTSNRIYQKMQNEINNVPGGGRSLDRLWAGVAISLYGKKLCKKLCDFIVTYQINDLHGNNIGYKDDRPILLDFSGYSRSSC